MHYAPQLSLKKKTLSIEAANKILAGAVAEARANNWAVNIAVVEDGGHLLAFQRMDGASFGAIDTSLA
jgi:uncharacterized protein GlcG (DUF336 family)